MNAIHTDLPKQFFLTRAAQFFYMAVTRSLTDLNFYVDILNLRFRYSFRVLFFFYVIISVVLTSVFTLITLPKWRRLAQESIQEVAQSYPDNAVVSWNGQELSSLQSEVISLPFPHSLENKDVDLNSIVTIDSNSTTGPENLSSLLFFNKHTIYINSTNGSWTEQPIHQLLGDNPYIFNRAYILQMQPAFSQMVQDTLSITPFLAFLLFSVGLFVSRLVMLIFDAIIIQFVLQLMGKPLQYWKVYQMCLHLLIPVELINQITLLLYPSLDIPMFTLSFWILAILVLWHLRDLHVLSIDVKEEKK